MQKKIIPLIIEKQAIQILIEGCLQAIKFKIDLNVSYTFFTSGSQMLPSFLTIEAPYQDATIFGYTYLCQLVYSDAEQPTSKLKLKYFLFYYHESGISLFPRLGLSFKPDKESSIIYSAYNDKHIDSLSFAIKMTNIDDGFLFLGGVPNNISNYKKGTCKVVNTFSTWGCNVTSVVFLAFKYVCEEYGYFNNLNVVSYVSKSFKEFFGIKIGELKRVKDKKQFFPIKITIGDKIYTEKNVVSRDNRGVYFIEWRTTYGDFFAFGYPFFENRVLMFDYENEKIIIYENDEIEYIGYKVFLFKLVLICNSIILYIGIMLLGIVTFKGKLMNKK